MTVADPRGAFGRGERFVPFEPERCAGEASIGERLLFDTPVMLPTGTCITVAVERAGPSSWIVSDLGLTHAEAVLLDCAEAYERRVREAAKEVGVEIDPSCQGVFVRVKDVRQIGPALACVANAACRAFERALELRATRVENKRLVRLAHRLESLLRGVKVERSVEIFGSSNHIWQVDLRVRRADRQFLLDLVSPHATSVTTTATKFHDIARLPDPPDRIAVVPSREAMGTWLGVLSQAANVVEEGASDRTWQRALAA